MEAIKQIISSDLLNGVIALPRVMQNKKVEVIVMLADEKRELPPLTIEHIDAMIGGSVTESLIGILPNLSMSLEDYRKERLQKHECAD
ncbi:MAG: hypothetical protein LBI54_08325 [Lachnospiraceae bacterium]|jgi:hypothetical protein|nr:hypothetical protein [Lachnospiraceae bacterium]